MTTVFIVQPEAMPAWHSLGGVLADLAEDGRTTPCMTDPEPFVSDDHRERREAAKACRGACPVVSACAAYADANAEPAHVWGGRDRTTTTRNRKAAA